jgi:site-specific DNA-methyltransferase (adenine-specific)
MQRKARQAVRESGGLTLTGASPLSNEESNDYEAHNERIARGFKAFCEVGESLLDIRRRRLYREEYATFEDYLLHRWDMRQSRAYQLMDAATTIDNLKSSTIVELPANEAQARPLASLEPEVQVILWDVVQQTAPNGKVTAEHVKSVVSVLREVTATGAIDDGTGESIPVSAATLTHVKAAVVEETYERLQRQSAYINEKQSRKQQGKQEREIARSAIPVTLSGPLWQLFSGDLREQMTRLDANSIDAIITDPPYPAEYLPLYGALAQEAARVLKPGASLLVMCGQSYLPQIMSLMETCLTYHWTLAYMTPGGQSPQIWPRKVNTFWKPILWYVKGDYAGDWHGDVIKSERNEKDAHHWQQSISGMSEMVHKFTLPDQLILDPFCGSGTTGVACVTQARRFIGIDIDESALQSARERLTHG